MAAEKRAAQYAVCTWSLMNDPAADGAAAVFDQALSNGLAAVVAHHWPGEEARRSGRIKSANELLDVVEAKGLKQEDDLWYLPHGDPDELWIEVQMSNELSEGEPGEGTSKMPNFTVVRVGTLRKAIDYAQSIRHAREDAGHGSLPEEYIKALAELDYSPALFALSQEEVERVEEGASRARVEEAGRAEAYWEALGAEERARRGEQDLFAFTSSGSPGELPELQTCPICQNECFVAEARDLFVDEIGVGFCIACSFRRSQEVADDEGLGVTLSRVAER